VAAGADRPDRTAAEQGEVGALARVAQTANLSVKVPISR
jgi:hypothetical protein